MLLYRFDDPDAFPLIASHTTARAVSLFTDARHPDRVGVEMTRQPGESGDLVATIALPFRSIAGQPETLRLAVEADGGGAQWYVEAADAGGRAVSFSLGATDFHGPGTCAARLHAATVEGVSESPSTPRNVDLPIQFQRLRVVLPAAAQGCRVHLASLDVIGCVRRPADGIA
jgi:hypothetical protein